jgi:hypothetical protein
MKRKLFIGFSLVILLLVLGCAFALGRLIHRGFSTRDKPTAIEASLATSMREMAIPAGYKTMNNPTAVTPAVLHEALAHWADHCALCHANNDSSDTMFQFTIRVVS